ncbi:MAG: hypothetical protein MRY76_06810 [Pseudomonadales bacterium]|nr:hypothetical protein [Pseudomonadales bacterium]
MSFKPVVLLYDLNNKMVDECAKIIGKTGLYTTINTYNEVNAIEALRQYDRMFGLLTNRLSCVITGWNNYKRPRDQFLFRIRQNERRSPLRSSTPVILITEDHRNDLRQIALDPTDGNVAAYLHVDDFQDSIAQVLQKVVFDKRAQEMNSIAYAKLQREMEDEE